MKRGKDDEKKIGGPMFPRLHVNDTDKGGPRAPPRNKMALYEQLSVPSQRFNSGVPPNPNSSTNSGYPQFSSQVGGHERSRFSSLQLPPSIHSAEKMSSRYSDVNSQLVQKEQKKKQDEDDFRVPIFVQSGITPDRRGNHIKRGNEGHATSTPAPISSSNTSHSVKHHYASERDPKRRDAIDLNLRQDPVTLMEENSRENVASVEQSVKSASNQSFPQSDRNPLKQTNTFSSFGLRNNVSKSYSQLQSNGNVQPDCGAESQRDSTLWVDSVSNGGIRVIEAHPEMLRSSNDPINGDAVSETSMVDSISGIDISPDDVVGIIGQKHFWKARRAIVNQQRVFAVQVFELHRLLKVQKLIAGSPQLLVEENAYLGKPVKVIPAKKLPLEYIVKPTSNISKRKEDCDKSSQNVEFSAENAYLEKPVKVIPAKKLPLEYIVKPTSNISKRTDDFEKTSQNVEFSAENAVGKTSPSSVQNGSQVSSYKPFPGDPQSTADPKMGPWGFNQPPGHQWLIPVMTPYEGLVYKPYPGPGFVSPACGGCGPPGPTPMMGHNFMNYGVPPPPHHHYQGLGIPPFAPPPSHGYFPPYGIPSMNPTISSSAGEHTHNFNTQHQNSSNIPSEVPYEKKRSAAPKVGKFHASKESEVQVSTASSPSERTRVRNPLPLFPTSLSVQFPERVPDQAREVVDPPSLVIRVVPHNARSATASVARIFQSIQEERKQYESG